MTRPLRYLSVCSGIEAATQAWHPLGWQPVAFSEIEPFPCAVLAHHYPHVPNCGDMTKFEEWPDADVDVLCGGTPCQSFSVAGLRQGLADPRGNLMLTFGAIAGRYRPRWLVWENVPGVLSSNGGGDFGAFLGMLGQLGYGFAYRVLDAQHVRTRRFPYAVPQRRRRVFVVGYLGDWRRAAAVLFDRESLSGNPAPCREAGQSVTHPVAGSLTSSGRGIERAGDTRGQDPVIATITSHDPACTLTARERKGALPEADLSTVVAHALRGEGFDASEDGTGRGTPIVPVAWAIMPQNSGKDYKAKPSDVAQPIMAGGPSIGNQGGDFIQPTPWAVRRLTPRECERLQGFPDDFTSIPTYDGWRRMDETETPESCEAEGMKVKQTKTGWWVNDPDGPRYKALGNSMAVNVMEWLGERIAIVDAMEAAA